MNIMNKRIAFLDYLRIFAFVSVLIGHKFYDKIAALANNEAMNAFVCFLAKLSLPFFVGGGAGVVVFFLVSGYIIMHVLQTEKAADFAIKRAFRIYPLYIAAVLIQTAIDVIYHTGNYPVMSILVPQLLLIGDFFGTPCALGFVEWTLRVEVMFYVFMAILSSLGFIHKYKKILPYIMFAMVVLLGLIAPIPAGSWAIGYLTIYGPFLFLGSIFYLVEKKEVSYPVLLSFVVVIFYQYFNLIATFQSNWLKANFAVLGFSIFTFCWMLRKYIKVTPGILLFSNLTYAVYLFHNWLFDYIKIAIEKLHTYIYIYIIRQYQYPSTDSLISILFICGKMCGKTRHQSWAIYNKKIKFACRENATIRGGNVC